MKRDGWPPVVTDEDRRRFPGWSRMLDEVAAKRRKAVKPDPRLVASGRRGAVEATRRKKLAEAEKRG